MEKNLISNPKFAPGTEPKPIKNFDADWAKDWETSAGKLEYSDAPGLSMAGGKIDIDKDIVIDKANNDYTIKRPSLDAEIKANVKVLGEHNVKAEYIFKTVLLKGDTAVATFSWGFQVAFPKNDAGDYSVRVVIALPSDK